MRYIITGLLFGLIYNLVRLEFSIDGIFAGLIIGGGTGVMLTPFSNYIDRNRIYNECNPLTMRKVSVCVLYASLTFIMISIMVIIWP